MPYCPQCRDEFRPGYTRCEACGCELVDTLPPLPEQPEPNDPYMLLTTIQGGPLGEPSLAILRAYEIPYLTDYADAGAVSVLYCGKSLTGLNVYVPTSCMEEARRLLAPGSTDYCAFQQITSDPFSFDSLDDVDLAEFCNIYNFYRVNGGYGPDTAPVDPDWIQEHLLPLYEDTTGFAVRRGKKTVGFCTVIPLSEPHEGEGELHLFLSPELVDPVNFTSILQRALAQAEAGGWKRLISRLPEHPVIPVEEYYEQQGFAKICTEGECLWEKSLP